MLFGRVERVMQFVPPGEGRGALPGRVTESDVAEAKCQGRCLAGRASSALTSAAYVALS